MALIVDSTYSYASRPRWTDSWLQCHARQWEGNTKRSWQRDVV